MYTFKDLKFKNHQGKLSRKEKKALLKRSPMLRGSDMFKTMKHAVLHINGHRLSDIKGVMFYSNGKNTYEAWCEALDDDPRGYLTKQEVNEYIKEIYKLPII